MEIDGEKVPEKEGYKTIIHLCINCKSRHGCDCVTALQNGWCYTLDKISNA